MPHQTKKKIKNKIIITKKTRLFDLREDISPQKRNINSVRASVAINKIRCVI